MYQSDDLVNSCQDLTVCRAFHMLLTLPFIIYLLYVFLIFSIFGIGRALATWRLISVFFSKLFRIMFRKSRKGQHDPSHIELETFGAVKGPNVDQLISSDLEGILSKMPGAPVYERPHYAEFIAGINAARKEQRQPLIESATTVEQIRKSTCNRGEKTECWSCSGQICQVREQPSQHPPFPRWPFLYL